MNEVQIWSIIATFIGTVVGQQVVGHLLGRGKVRSDEGTALRAELRADNKSQNEEIKELRKRVNELEEIVVMFRLRRIDMYRVLQENNVNKEVLAELRLLEAPS